MPTKQEKQVDRTFTAMEGMRKKGTAMTGSQFIANPYTRAALSRGLKQDRARARKVR